MSVRSLCFHPVTWLMLIASTGAEAEMVAFTQGLLSSVDPRTLRGFFDPADSEPSSSRASPLPTPSDLSEGKLARPRITSPLGSSQSLPHDIPSTNGEAESAIASLSSVEGLLHASNKQFLLRVGGKVIVFELSLCGGDDFGHNRVSSSPPGTCATY
jgi:hypothetical protein